MATAQHLLSCVQPVQRLLARAPVLPASLLHMWEGFLIGCMSDGHYVYIQFTIGRLVLSRNTYRHPDFWRFINHQTSPQQCGRLLTFPPERIEMLKTLASSGLIFLTFAVFKGLFFAHSTRAAILTSPQHLRHGVNYDFIVIGGMAIPALHCVFTDDFHYRWCRRRCYRE